MKYDARFATVAVFAFAAGLLVARLPLPAHAAAAPLVAQTYDLTTYTAATLPPPGTQFPQLQSKTLVVTDGATLAVQLGTAFKHYHADANEIQIFLDGVGTEQLGDNRVAVKPGTMVVIPKGTAHAAFTATSGTLKWVSIKSPPQDPADVHPM